jgi:glycosyltransferase involved in cell wall biosynthesis
LAKEDPENNTVIYINGRFLTQPVTGVQRYAYEVVKGLDSLCEQGVVAVKRYRFVILAPRRSGDMDLKHIAVQRVGMLRGHLWEQIELPLHAAGGVLFNPCNTAPLAKLNQVVTIHDASVFGFPRAYSLLFRSWYRLLLVCLGRTAKRILTDSEFSRRELMAHCGIRSEKLAVIPLGKEHILALEEDDAILHRHDLRDGRYVLAVSSMNPNKNFATILRAIELLGDVDYDVAIAGGTNPKIFGHVQLQQSRRIKMLGYVNDRELKSLYRHAACFVFPSFYEGFGLPPLEAMACGCPVIAAHTSSLPEVCGDACLYCDPDSPEDVARQIHALMADDARREGLGLRGADRSRMFGWERCARETLAVLDEVTGTARP